VSGTAELTAEHHRDYAGAKLGMWLFLVTELLLFGGLFLLYSMYRATHAEAFHHGAMELDTFVGTINTLILLTSSLTMALSIALIHRGRKKLSLLCVASTVGFGIWFMVNKYFEWGEKFEHGIYPGSETLIQRGQGETLFFGLYFSMTGLHGLHVLVGVVLLTIVAFKLAKQPSQTVLFEGDGLERLKGAKIALIGEDRGELWASEAIDDSVQELRIGLSYRPVKKRIHPEDFVLLENAGLYWHLVDVIWIYLFPLYYLIT